MARKNGNAADNETSAAKSNGADVGEDSKGNGGKNADVASADQAQASRFRNLSHFIRDMSFENVASSKEITGKVEPEVKIEFGLGSKPRGEDRYESSIKVKVDSKNKGGGEQIFLLEAEYVGIFEAKNVTEQQLSALLMIEGPRMIFPYLRRVVADITRDGGFLPFTLQEFDFVRIYQEVQRRRAEEEKKGQEADDSKLKELSGTA